MPMPPRNIFALGKAGAAARAVELLFGSWLVVTVLSQHPHRTFDRLRTYDKIGLLIPNWRFFAPEPAQHDYHLLYRTLSTTGQESPWKSASQINARTWGQVVWFPGRRQEKAVFDICNEIVGLVGKKDVKIVDTAGYGLLRDFVIRQIRENDDERNQALEGFQFLVVQYSGHDDSEDPKYAFISPLVPFEPVASAGNI